MDIVNACIKQDIMHQENTQQWLEIGLRLLSLQECFAYADLHATIDTPALLLL